MCNMSCQLLKQYVTSCHHVTMDIHELLRKEEHRDKCDLALASYLAENILHICTTNSLQILSLSSVFLETGECGNPNI